MANTDATGSPKPPPHLRVSENEDRECDTCTHFLNGKCHMYNDLPVNDEWVCDSWEKGKNQDPDQADEDEAYGAPAEGQPKNFKDARIRVKAHFRRAKSAPQEQ